MVGSRSARKCHWSGPWSLVTTIRPRTVGSMDPRRGREVEPGAYPVELAADVVLTDGRALSIRAIRPDDAPASLPSTQRSLSGPSSSGFSPPTGA